MTLQVVIFALLAAKMFSLSDRKGVVFCTGLILFSWAKMYHSALVYPMTPTLMVPVPNLPLNREYLVNIHEPWSTYLSPFFMGFLAGYWILSGGRLRILSVCFGSSFVSFMNLFRQKFDWIKWIVLTAIPFEISHLICVISNSYDAMPPALLPLAITANRNMIGVGTVLLLLIIYSENPFSKCKFFSNIFRTSNNFTLSDLDVEKNNNEKEDRVVFSLFTGLLRISFSMFFINLYVARFEFFARKSLIANEALTNVSIFSIVNILCL